MNGTSKCEHAETTTGQAYGYQHSVATPRITDENRAAHGGVCFRETCSACGAERMINTNGCHSEYSAWGASAAKRAEIERLRNRDAIKAVNATMEEHGVCIDRLTRMQAPWHGPANWRARVELGGEARVYDRDRIVAAETWSENNDEQRAIMRALREACDKAAATLAVGGA